jgi:hypothetical protein
MRITNKHTNELLSFTATFYVWQTNLWSKVWREGVLRVVSQVGDVEGRDGGKRWREEVLRVVSQVGDVEEEVEGRGIKGSVTSWGCGGKRC